MSPRISCYLCVGWIYYRMIVFYSLFKDSSQYPFHWRIRIRLKKTILFIIDLPVLGYELMEW